MSFDFHSPIDVGTRLYIVDKKSGEHRMQDVYSIKLISRHVGLACGVNGDVICPISDFEDGKGCYMGDNYITTDVLDALRMVERLKGEKQ